MYIRFYRDDLFKTVKERIKEVPQGKALRLYLFLVLEVGYFSFDSNDGIFIYESNSGRNAIVRKRYTNNEIQREIIKGQLGKLDRYDWDEEMVEKAAAAVIAWLEEETDSENTLGYEFVEEEEDRKTYHVIYERVMSEKEGQMTISLESLDIVIEDIFIFNNFGAAVRGWDNLYIEF